MAAIKPYLEEAERIKDAGQILQEYNRWRAGCSMQTLQGLGAGASCDLSKGAKLQAAFEAALRAQHAEMTRTVWMRHALAQVMQGNSIRVQEGADGRLEMVLARPLDYDAVPWNAGPDMIRRFDFWGEAGKMGCPTWDLPAGSPLTGGACPGATYGQTVVPASMRGGGSIPRPVPGESGRRKVDLLNSICGECYALRGKYPTITVLLKNHLRFSWLKQLHAEGRDREIVHTIVDSMLRLRYPLSRGVYPVRVHSSGDLFELWYAKVWVDVANELKRIGGDASRILIWMPTRAWAHFDLKPIFSRLDRKGGYNMVVRPSAYHMDDAAPGEILPGLGFGATSVRRPNNWEEGVAVKPPGAKPRYDFDCPVYSERHEGLASKTPGEKIGSNAFVCASVRGKDGKAPCRECWIRPDLRINYTAH